MQVDGHEVYGSDRSLSPLTEELEAQGVFVSDNQDGTFVPDDIDLFVYSEAIPADAPERMRAVELGVRQVSYFKALGELSSGKRVIAIAGTHGKSTTTAMVAKALTDAGLDPTVVVGTKVPQLSGRNWRKGGSDLFVLEACEYKGSFLHLHPSIIIVTNIDWDHVDAYPTKQAYEDAYRQFIQALPPDGMLIAHEADLHSTDRTDISIVHADDYPTLLLSVPGSHMQQNAQLVQALGDQLGVAVDSSLQDFTGTWRRFEKKGVHSSGAIIIDDYAHHPREIVATIESAHLAFPNKRILCLFQPHMHDRTLALYNDFVQAFHGVAHVLLTDVYEARREQALQVVDMHQFAEDIGEHCINVGNLEAAYDFCCNFLQQDDVLLVMGAGDVTTVASRLTT